MTELSIDTKNKKVWARVELLGEREPVEIEVTRYSLSNSTDGTYLTIEEATASRAWLAEALRQFVVGQTFSVPPKAAALLKLLA